MSDGVPTGRANPDPRCSCHLLVSAGPVPKPHARVAATTAFTSSGVVVAPRVLSTFIATPIA